MLTALLRLFALRPILAGSLLGIPLLTLILLGLAAAVFLKLLLFVGLPILLGLLILRTLRKPRHEPVEPVQTM